MYYITQLFFTLKIQLSTYHMNLQKSTQQNEIKRFWDNYIARLKRTGIKDNVIRWYVIRSEQYIKAFPDKRLAEHGPQEVNAYLEQQGKNRWD